LMTDPCAFSQWTGCELPAESTVGSSDTADYDLRVCAPHRVFLRHAFETKRYEVAGHDDAAEQSI
jgi:hypothetical protein